MRWTALTVSLAVLLIAVLLVLARAYLGKSE